MSARSSESSSSVAYIRRAQHAGSWYSDDGAVLRRSFDGWLKDATAARAAEPAAAVPRLTGIICPHAGYRFSGPTAAHAFARVRDELTRDASIDTVIVLGPSHKIALDGVALSGASHCETPVGDLIVDTEVVAALAAALPSPLSRPMRRGEDENEHSLEMQLPFLAHAIAAARGGSLASVRIVPIMVGRISGTYRGSSSSSGGGGGGGGGLGGAVRAAIGSVLGAAAPTTIADALAAVLSQYLPGGPADSGTAASTATAAESAPPIAAAGAPPLPRRRALFVVSSDFAHYGERFDFAPFENEAERVMLRASGSGSGGAGGKAAPPPAIHACIEALDRRGMSLIEAGDGSGFEAYLRETGNTICGRNPIALFLRAADAAGLRPHLRTRFVAYAQSSRVTEPGDSSVSYAAALAEVIEPAEVTTAPGGGGGARGGAGGIGAHGRTAPR